MTVTNEMIEAAAKAMCTADGAKWDALSVNETANGEEPEEQREYWRHKAEAALSAAPQAVAVNGIPATHRHDEGAIARCSYCGRYSIDPATLSNRQPKCDCGEELGWCGSFKRPGPDAKWSGKAPTTPPAQAVGVALDRLPAGHIVLEQSDMQDGRVSQTVRVEATGEEYARIVHSDEAYWEDE